jgi:phenylpropionate dioxygenase-like ring-hydroxylating dioxygenase large terminal subunit
MASTPPSEHPAVPHVGTYRRELPVSVERLYENAIDWEHLPYLHRTSFARVECLDAGPWGFRARVWGQPYDERREFTIELKLDRECRRWITSTLEGPGRGSEIWTHAFPIGDRETHIVVDFFVPEVSRERAPEIAGYYKALYARLYDEDESMMTGRQTQLDAIKNRASGESRSPRVLGSLEYVRMRLPMTIEERGRRFRIVELDGKLIAHATVCPHTLGPLGTTTVTNGIVECPWHGFRFDIVTGKCVSGQTCSLAPAPKIIVDAQSSDVIVEWNSDTP